MIINVGDYFMETAHYLGHLRKDGSISLPPHA